MDEREFIEMVAGRSTVGEADPEATLIEIIRLARTFVCEVCKGMECDWDCDER